MTDQIRQIADRIRGLREIARLSVETCAADLGIPAKTYREYESGSTDIPVSFLYQTANKFQVELSSILTGEEPRLRVYSITRGGHGVKVERRKDYDYQSLAFNFIDKKMQPFLITVEPRPEPEPIPLNSHPGQEFEYVLEGTLKLLVGGHEVVLAAGDSVYFDSSHPHGLKAVGKSPARFVAVIL
jgi:mannose-6-phosphate isomerase-like protein (cupin superfamily)